MRRRLAALLVGVAASTGCALALPAPTRPDPRFERDYLRSLRHGMSPETVRALLGDPASERTSSRREDWRYEHFEQFKICVPVLLGVQLTPVHGIRSQIDLRFGQTGLERATLTKRLDRSATRVDLLAPATQ